MIRVGITGADGFIGWHLRALLHGDSNIASVPAGREVFANPEKLREFAGGVDVIVHLAGANRGDDRAVRETNIALAEQLVAACEAARATPHILFANTTHHTHESAYGESKRIAADKLAAWAAKSNALFTSLVLPHVFGEGSRPFYNSAVATFCYQLAHDEAPRIIEDRELELLHVQRLAEKIRIAICEAQSGEIRPHGAQIRVSELLATLQRMAQQYSTCIMPELASTLQLELFNSYQWYLFPQHYPVDLNLRRDGCNIVFDPVKALRGGEGMPSTTAPGMTRGNHYHRRKLERLGVLRGDALIRIRRLLDGAVTEFRMSGVRPQVVDVPTLHTHNITNIGASDLMTLSWTHGIFDTGDPDTYPEEV